MLRRLVVAAIVAAIPAVLGLGVGRAEEPAHLDAPAPLEVVVCESHHEVLRHWLRARDGALPGSGVTIVHFDAHPDMAVPPEPTAALLRPDPEELDAFLRSLDIASFQLGAVWLGLVDRIIWLRPDWATQLPDGEHRFRLGLDASSRLRVDDPNDYYVLDEAWATGSSLGHPVEVELLVLPLSAAMGEDSIASGPTILDIDLDGFATHNPSADAMRRAGLGDADIDRIRSAFAPENLSFSADPETRIAELEGLLEAVAAVGGENLLDQLVGAFQLWRFGIGIRELWGLYEMLERLGPEAPPTLLIEEGRGVVGLPERRADWDEVANTVAQLAALLESGAVQPQLITIARSVRDGFTPGRDWPAIEWQLLHGLHRVLPAAQVRFDSGLSPAPGPFSIGGRGTASPHPR